MPTLAVILLIKVQADKFNTFGANLDSRGNLIPVVATSHYTMFGFKCGYNKLTSPCRSQRPA